MIAQQWCWSPRCYVSLHLSAFVWFCFFSLFIHRGVSGLRSLHLLSTWRAGEQPRALVAFHVARKKKKSPLAFSGSPLFAWVGCSEARVPPCFSWPRALVSISFECQAAGSEAGQDHCFNWSVWGLKELLHGPDLQKKWTWDVVFVK